MQSPPFRLLPYRSRQGQRSDRRRSGSGFTLIEVIISIAVFALFVSIYASTLPPVIRSTGHASNYLQANALARHKIEQIRQVGFTHLNGTDLKQLGVIDSATANSDGSFSFATVDNLVNSATTVGYFGASTNATGKIAFSRPLSGQGTSAPTQTQANQVAVSITWSGGGTPGGTYQTQTIIVAP